MLRMTTALAWRQALALSRQQQQTTWRMLSTAAPESPVAEAAAIPQDKIKCVACGQVGHLAKDCPSGKEAAKKALNELFDQGRCLLCGELGHVAKACPSLGRNPDDAPPPVPHAKLAPAEKYAHKVCFQCGATGHLMRDCPVAPYHRKIKGIEKRYSGSRLQKMLPELLKTEREIRSAHESFANVPPKMGVVVSTSSRKTIGVLIPRTELHPLLKIPVDKSRKFMVHDEEETAVCGDVVMIQQTRPISKNKHFSLKQIVLSYNARKQNTAEKVAQAKKVYEGITEEVLRDLEEKQNRYEVRMTELRNREKNLAETHRKQVYAEAQKYQADLDAIVAEGEEKLEKGNETWVGEMSKQMAEKDKESETLLAKATADAQAYREKQEKAALDKLYYQKPKGGNKSN